MAEEKIYLELSEEGGGSHKFYEVVIDDTKLTIRYGRIGDAGQSSTKDFASNDIAKKEAAKKIKEKKNKGYEEAVMGVRKKRTITRRVVESQKSTSKQAPVLWKFNTGRNAFGIFINENHAWVGNENGDIYVLDHLGTLLSQYKLPEGVKAIVADGEWIYAGCDDGNVYDLTGKIPRIAYEISENVDIFWIDVNNALLGVSDANGKVMIANHENEDLWERKSAGYSGWMVRCDQDYVYHGHSAGVTAYHGWNQPVVKWTTPLGGSVLFGWQEKNTVYAGCSNGKVYELNKSDGKIIAECKCDNAVLSCATSPDGEYIFAGDSFSSVYCFKKDGTRLWKLGSGCGSPLSMQYYKDKVYIVTTDGSLASIDASESAIKAAEAGTVPVFVDIKAPKTTIAIVNSVETDDIEAKKVSGLSGVIVMCYSEGSKLRMKTVGSVSECSIGTSNITASSTTFDTTWHIQFPKNLRQDGTYYLVDEVKESSTSGFYRAKGNIRRIKF